MLLGLLCYNVQLEDFLGEQTGDGCGTKVVYPDSSHLCIWFLSH